MSKTFSMMGKVFVCKEKYLNVDAALEAVVCNAMLQDDASLLKLYKGNRTLFERVMAWVREFLDEIKATGAVLAKRNADWKQMDALKGQREMMREPKGSKSAHSLSEDTVLALEKELDEPKVVFEKAERNSLYVMTALKDKNGNPVMLVIQKDQTDPDGEKMHQLKTGYGLTNALQYMLDHLKTGSRFYAKNNEALLQVMAGAQSSIDAADIQLLEKRFTRIKPQEETDVNEKFSRKATDSEGNTLTEAQQEYFADSKVCDKSGALKASRLQYALLNDSDENVLLFYVNKEKTISALQRAGYTITGSLSDKNGSIHSIAEKGSPVKLRVGSQTESIQFREWFGNSQIKNNDGKPKIMYRGGGEDINIFDRKKARAAIYMAGGSTSQKVRRMQSCTVKSRVII